MHSSASKRERTTTSASFTFFLVRLHCYRPKTRGIPDTPITGAGIQYSQKGSSKSCKIGKAIYHEWPFFLATEVHRLPWVSKDRLHHSMYVHMPSYIEGILMSGSLCVWGRATWLYSGPFSLHLFR